MKRLLYSPPLVVLLVAALWLFVAGASDSNSTTVQYADAGAGFVIVVVLPLLLRFVKLDGPQMVAVSWLLSALVASIALFASGQVAWPPDTSSLPALLSIASAAWGVQQLVFQVFKDSSTVGPLLTGAPASKSLPFPIVGTSTPPAAAPGPAIAPEPPLAAPGPGAP